MKKVSYDITSKNFIIDYSDFNFTLPFKQHYFEYYSELDLESYDLFILQNPIFINEVDCFEVYVDSRDRTGYVFPLSLLDSEDEYDSKIGQYIFVASLKLLSSDVINVTGENVKVFSDLFSNYENICLLVLSHYEAPSYNFLELKLNLQCYGYITFNEKQLINFGNLEIQKNVISLLFTDKNKIKIKKTNYDLYKDTIINTIISVYLPFTPIPAQRFLFVYQIIEYYMREIESTKINEIIEMAKLPSPDINQLIDRIQKIRKEITRLNEIYNPNKPSKRYDPIRNVFFDLYTKIFFETIRDESQCIYNIRNKLFNSYWCVLEDNIIEFDKLLLLSEQLIYGMLIEKFSI